MRQLPYNNSAATIRLEFPVEWDVDNLTGVNISIAELDGDALLAATAATLYTATTTNATASVGDSTVTLANDASAPSPGDRLRIADSAAGPSEEIEVESYNSSTKVVTLKRELRYAHTSGTAVKGLFCTYDLDTSTVATWAKALQVVITWTPVGSDDLAVTERAEVAAVYYSFPDFKERFRVRYPREFKLKEKEIDAIYQEAEREVQADLRSIEFNIDRLVDQGQLHMAILKKTRLIVCESGGNKWEYETNQARDEYQRYFETFKNTPQWSDDNQDGVQDDYEIDDLMGLLGSERGR